MSTPLIDAYVHLGVPRFQTLESALTTMDQYGIAKAVVSCYATGPDVATVHEALTRAPERFLAMAFPIGRERAELEASLRAQFAAGFAGLRIDGPQVAAHPWILELAGEAGRFVFVSDVGLDDAAPHLLDHLAKHPDGLVVAGDFTGVRDPARIPEALRDLFEDDRFLVVCANQGIFPEPAITQWAEALIEFIGWDRLMWASESPTIQWRDESVGDALAWFDRFTPTAAQREAFFGGTAQARLFERPAIPVAELDMPFDPFDFVIDAPAPLWRYGLGLDTALPARLMKGWQAWGGDRRGPLRHYLEDVLREHLPEL